MATGATLTKEQSMTEFDPNELQGPPKPFVDPNSGAAPQPGGYVLGGAYSPAPVDPDEKDESADKDDTDNPRLDEATWVEPGDLSSNDSNVTMPEDANDPGPEGEQKPQNVETPVLPEEEQLGAPAAAELETQAAGPAAGDESTVAGTYTGPVGEGTEVKPGEVGVADNRDQSSVEDNGDQSVEVKQEEEPAKQEEPAPVMAQPHGNASKVDWTNYAKSKGATDEDLEGKSRDEIRAAYGSDNAAS